ncbi:MAG: right-handed parallel beta-helix repeat-containing protein [Myxococcota bacterium]
MSRSIPVLFLSVAISACGDDAPESFYLDGAVLPDADLLPDADRGADATPDDAVVGQPDGAADAATDATLSGSAHYVAVDGDDAAPGTELQPFATIARAIEAATAGDAIFVRGGTYSLEETIVLYKSGSDGAPFRLWAYPGESPILDFSTHPRHANPPQPRDSDTIASVGDAFGIHAAGDFWHVRGLTVRFAPYYGVRVYGSNNIFERLVLHDNKASGLEITGKEGFEPSNNLVLNSDSFHNFDPQSGGEDADGFAAKFDSLGPGNVFRGTRAWSNSDDGYDFWHARNPILVENCWAFDNGFNRPEWVVPGRGFEGDGLGFKLGQDASELQLRRVVAFGNKAFGIDENGNRSARGVTILHATLVNNAKDGNPVQLDLRDGQPHTVVNSIAFDVDGAGVVQLDSSVQDQSNTWNGRGVSAADFEHLDMARLFEEATSPRGPSGELPPLGLRLAPTSRLIDAGRDTGATSFAGAAPDLGAFEQMP